MDMKTIPLNQCFGFTLGIGVVGREGIDTIYIKLKLPWYVGDISTGFKLVICKDFISTKIQNLFEIRSPRAHKTEAPSVNVVFPGPSWCLPQVST